MLKLRIAAFCAATIVAIGALVAKAVLDQHDVAIGRANAEAATLAAALEERRPSGLDAVPGLRELIKPSGRRRSAVRIGVASPANFSKRKRTPILEKSRQPISFEQMA